MNAPRINTHWSAQRSEVIHTVTKAGTSVRLWFTNAELELLRDQIDIALRGRSLDAAG